MERAHDRTRQLPPLQRGFERSRLEEELIATAYELAVPLCRQSLSTPQRSGEDETRQSASSATQGGLSA